MADYLKNFAPGEDIKASETNNNNQFLLDKISDNAGILRDYLDKQIATLQSNLSSIQKTLQSNIDALAVKVDENNYFQTNKYNYIKFPNGLIIQWGTLYDDPNNVKYGTYTQYLPIPFSSSNYSIAVSSNYQQRNGDKSATIQIYPTSPSTFAYSMRYEQYRGSLTYWIAIGF